MFAIERWLVYFPNREVAVIICLILHTLLNKIIWDCDKLTLIAGWLYF